MFAFRNFFRALKWATCIVIVLFITCVAGEEFNSEASDVRHDVRQFLGDETGLPERALNSLSSAASFLVFFFGVWLSITIVVATLKALLKALFRAIGRAIRSMVIKTIDFNKLKKWSDI